MALPKLGRDAYREQLRREFEKTLQAVTDAVDNAPKGQIIPHFEALRRRGFLVESLAAYL